MTATTSTATTATETTATETTATETSTTTLICNGLPDPLLCGTQDSKLCTHKVTGPDLRMNCPVLCNACIPTTTTTTGTSTTVTDSTTTTSASTTTTEVCDGLPDPNSCLTLAPVNCNDQLLGGSVSQACPVLCKTCP